ncbi:hypothetical protein ACFZAR_05560 [Streptomyces sp. NPDC008222]|uniref:hypothetical protein n=1 Tax=Streptomyces sp. NPDC008222 TaxID=3364820 RepID=UPI0036EED7B7
MEPAIPLSEEVAEETAKQLIAAAYQPTSYRDDSPIPVVGTAPPVAQPGRPPMSQKAVDVNTTILSAGVASLPIGGSVSLVLYTLGHVDPVSLAIGAAAPVAFALAIGTLLRSLRGLHTETHHHYDGASVYQSTTNTENHGVWVKTNNKR